MNNDLSHHGVIGQKWGIRRYQNPDGSLTPQGRLRYHYSTGKKLSRKERETQRQFESASGTTDYQKKQNVRSVRPFDKADRTDLTVERTIPKGTTFYRTGTNPKGDTTGDRYMSYLEVDRNLYKGGAIRFQAKGKDTYETSYTLKEDLKIPSRDRQLAAIEKYCKNNRKTYNTAAEMIVKSNALFEFDSRTDYDKWVKSSPVYKERVKDLVNQFKNRPLSEMMYVSAATFGVDADIRRKVIADLKKDGYTAMSDLAGVGGKERQAREGYDPIIVFDAKSMTKGKTEKISNEAENEAASRYDLWSWTTARSLAADVDEDYRKKHEAKWSDIP